MTAVAPSFCAQCGSGLVSFLDADQRARQRCSDCGVIVYQNPRVLVSTVVAFAETILLCRRAIAPAAGSWALPGGFMECGETLEEAAARETFEETGVRLDPQQLRLHAVSTLPEISEVYVGFVARLTQSPELACGAECSAVRFYDEQAIPWSELSYPDVEAYLRVYFQEQRLGTHVVHFNRLDAAGVSSQGYQVAQIVATRRPR